MSHKLGLQHRLRFHHSFCSSLAGRESGSNGARALPNRAVESLRTGAVFFSALLITLCIK